MTPMHETELTGRIMDWARRHTQSPEPGSLELSPETDLIATGVLDSIGFIELLACVEETTGREIDLSDVDPTDFTTAGGLAAFALGAARREGAHV